MLADAHPHREPPLDSFYSFCILTGHQNLGRSTARTSDFKSENQGSTPCRGVFLFAPPLLIITSVHSPTLILYHNIISWGNLTTLSPASRAFAPVSFLELPSRPVLPPASSTMATTINSSCCTGRASIRGIE